MGDTTSSEVTRRIEEHLPLVQYIVFQVAAHFPRHVDRDELASAGAVGLVQAAHRYDETLGIPFKGFAAQRIRGAILDAVRSADWAPRSIRQLARRLDSVQQRLSTELGRTPSTTETAQEMGLSIDELRRLQDRLFRAVVVGLEQGTTGDSDEGLTLVDILEEQDTLQPSDELEHRELRAYLRDAVRLLPERHRLVITGYFLEGKTSQDLASLLGVTESRISQIRSEALHTLRLGVEAQYAFPGVEALEGETKRTAKRRAQYAETIAAASGWKDRLDLRDQNIDLGEQARQLAAVAA